MGCTRGRASADCMTRKAPRRARLGAHTRRERLPRKLGSSGGRWMRSGARLTGRSAARAAGQRGAMARWATGGDATSGVVEGAWSVATRRPQHGSWATAGSRSGGTGAQHGRGQTDVPGHVWIEASTTRRARLHATQDGGWGQASACAAHVDDVALALPPGNRSVLSPGWARHRSDRRAASWNRHPLAAAAHARPRRLRSV